MLKGASATLFDETWKIKIIRVVSVHMAYSNTIIYISIYIYTLRRLKYFLWKYKLPS